MDCELFVGAVASTWLDAGWVSAVLVRRGMENVWLVGLGWKANVLFRHCLSRMDFNVSVRDAS